MDRVISRVTDLSTLDRYADLACSIWHIRLDDFWDDTANDGTRELGVTWRRLMTMHQAYDERHHADALLLGAAFNDNKVVLDNAARTTKVHEKITSDHYQDVFADVAADEPRRWWKPSWETKKEGEIK